MFFASECIDIAQSFNCVRRFFERSFCISFSVASIFQRSSCASNESEFVFQVWFFTKPIYSKNRENVEDFCQRHVQIVQERVQSENLMKFISTSDAITDNFTFFVDEFAECKKLCNTRGDIRSLTSEYISAFSLFRVFRDCVVHHRCIALTALVWLWRVQQKISNLQRANFSLCTKSCFCL